MLEFTPIRQHITAHGLVFIVECHNDFQSKDFYPQVLLNGAVYDVARIELSEDGKTNKGDYVGIIVKEEQRTPSYHPQRKRKPVWQKVERK